tara:strand:- start:11 stop:409 length:399 start_codon:yes stop_codon:yes gene_type:complete
MKINPILSYDNPTSGSVKATREDLLRLGVTEAEIEAGEKRFKTESWGCYGVTRSLRAVVECGDFGEHSAMIWKQFYPVRTMSNPRQSGYDMEGVVSVGGIKSTCFTSSQLFELPCGKLVDVAVIFSRSEFRR